MIQETNETIDPFRKSRNAVITYRIAVIKIITATELHRGDIYFVNLNPVRGSEQGGTTNWKNINFNSKQFSAEKMKAALKIPEPGKIPSWQ